MWSRAFFVLSCSYCSTFSKCLQFPSHPSPILSVFMLKIMVTRQLYLPVWYISTNICKVLLPHPSGLLWYHVIAIIIGNRPFLSCSLPQKILPNCVELDCPVLTSVDSTAISFFTQQGCQPCIQPPNLEDQVSVFMAHSDRLAQLYPEAPGSLFIAFNDSRLQWTYSNLPHMWYHVFSWMKN